MFSITSKQKNIQAYYQELKTFERVGQAHEGTVKIAFQHLLESIAKQSKWVLTQENTLKKGQKHIRLDGVLFDQTNLPRGYWEAKDSKDDLSKEVQKKLYTDNYPNDNILFQAPNRAILYQNGQEVLDVSLIEPANLVKILDKFFNFQRPEYERWDLAADEFKSRVPELAQQVLVLIQSARVDDKKFQKAFNGFADQCRQAINPNLANAALEEMLIQHLLTERIFRRIFNHPDFAKRNVIAREIENVIDKLTAKSFNRDAFFDELKYFYKALEDVAATIDEYSYKQYFLNTVYERFFQGFSVQVADTHGIVYTPQSIVDFMVKSVNEILDQEFGKSLASKGVHILDPFVGTGNFIVRIMREIATQSRMALRHKYKNELHCNEVMLLPYYIASMNIEHEFLDLMGNYQPYEGICLADTFELAEGIQSEMFAPENTKRVKKQQKTDFFVIIGNPPYNAGQINENDNNKNRNYPVIDGRVRETYSKDSKATLLRKLFDPYVKAIRWASDRIGDEGIVAFVSNNSFLDDLSFDGMRKHLEQDFSKIYILDLKGNVRKDSMRDGIPIGERHTVFGLSAMVGISITFLVKSKKTENGEIFYSAVDWKTTRQEKFGLIENAVTYSKLDCQSIQPDKKHTWLTEGLHSEFEEFLPLGTKESKRSQKAEKVVFKTYSLGVATNRDAWAYNFNPKVLAENMQRTIDAYNKQVLKWVKKDDKDTLVDDFVLYDDTQISWSRDLKLKLKRSKFVEFNADKIIFSLYRPFTKLNLFFDFVLVDVPGQFSKIFPTPKTENENRVICVVNEAQIPFSVQIAAHIPCLHYGGRQTQCFPFYTYDEDGTNRTDNITDWTLKHYQKHYKDHKINKLSIFHYVYGLLHHPSYREKYAANLKRELPRLPMAADFWAFSKSGAKLADLHLNYEDATPYSLKLIENPKVPFSLKVDKMSLSKDKKQLKYNDFLTLDGIPERVFDYKLGNRSALDWVIDQYRIKIDKRSGLINDPNREEDESYILELVKKVITVSLETQKVIEMLPIWKN
ncbi:adenine specific DNA methyltransferase [Beggiatoa sp. PS]|nr:adenine specific DNA methyltransferase [Beggiatoa sp. PS]